MKNTANRICQNIAGLLEAHGVRRVFASPGSRNAPLLIALSRRSSIHTDVVVDERSAAFMALGYSIVSQQPVAIVCTSGSALLNYAPAICEAYYRKTPIVVISADRPKAWIGQDDSQTIVQSNALANYVKRSYDIPSYDDDTNLWYANRVVNDALLTAVSGRVGPVHLNVQLDQPLGLMEEYPDGDVADKGLRVIKMISPGVRMETAEIRALGRTIASPRKVMIVCGFMSPDKSLNRALGRLSELPNVVVLTETIANLHNNYFVSAIDSTLASIHVERLDDMMPDVVISTGGALVSRHLKQMLRSGSVAEHWHVGENDDTVDCFQKLTLRVEMNPAVFFQQLASAMQPHRDECHYAHDWEVAKNRALSLTSSFSSKAPWSDFRAFSVIMSMIPRRWNVQLSNGTTVRYAQIFANHDFHRCDCNRGVSGIDGCTSTAIGASLAYNNSITLLISGDMSALYDMGALSSEMVTPLFKMIVVDNRGGGIFRFIPSTSDLDVREPMFCAPSSRSIGQIAKANGFKLFEAAGEEELRKVFVSFANECSAPSILVVSTPDQLSADVLKDYFNFCKTH